MEFVLFHDKTSFMKELNVTSSCFNFQERASRNPINFLYPWHVMQFFHNFSPVDFPDSNCLRVFWTHFHPSSSVCSDIFFQLLIWFDALLLDGGCDLTIRMLRINETYRRVFAIAGEWKMHRSCILSRDNFEKNWNLNNSTSKSCVDQWEFS